MVQKAPPKKGANTRDAAATRGRILYFATHAFAKSGFQGTSLSAVLAKAKVNKRMVYHYFGNKEGLYREVHLEQWRELETWFAEALTRSSQAGNFSLKNEELLLEAMGIFHDFIAGHPVFVHLLMWDGLEGGKVSRSLWKDIRGPLYRSMEALVLGAQDHGLLSKEIRADHLVVSVMGEISFYFAYANSLQDIFGKDPLSPTALAERKAQVMLQFKRLLNSGRNLSNQA
jgi:TetR/AcrR family transcriptional regulator